MGAGKLFSSVSAEQVEQSANPARESLRHTQAGAQLKEYYTSSGNYFQKTQTITTNYEQNVRHCLRQMFLPPPPPKKKSELLNTSVLLMINFISRSIIVKPSLLLLGL